MRWRKTSRIPLPWSETQLGVDVHLCGHGQRVIIDSLTSGTTGPPLRQVCDLMGELGGMGVRVYL